MVSVVPGKRPRVGSPAQRRYHIGEPGLKKDGSKSLGSCAESIERYGTSIQATQYAPDCPALDAP